MIVKFIIALLLTTVVPFAWALPTKGDWNFNCLVHSKVFYKTGEVKNDVTRFKYKTKKQCEKMTDILKDNFSPAEITKKEVKMEWRGK